MTLTQFRILLVVMMALCWPVAYHGFVLIAANDTLGYLNVLTAALIHLVGIYLMLPSIRFFVAGKKKKEKKS